MAVKSPFAPGLTTYALSSSRAPFSPYADSPWPTSAAAPGPEASLTSSNQLSVPAVKDAKSQVGLTAPSPIAPSPINSETTEFADVDDVDDIASSPRSPDEQPAKQKQNSIKSPSLKVDTSKLSFAHKTIRSDEDEPPASVIYAPAGFGDFNSSPGSAGVGDATRGQLVQPKLGNRTESTESIASDSTVTRVVATQRAAERFYDAQMPPTPLQTSIPSAPDWVRTPRAQTRQDLGVFSRPGSSLASINEGEDYSSDHSSTDEDEHPHEQFSKFFRNVDDDIKALNQALTECWTLCNTLASLSNVHRERIFNFSGKATMQQQAWKSCWKLCQNLYDARDDVTSTDVRTTLEYCRDFCQSLFDVRVRDNETADSVLRVSFELNNHLFNTHDRHLPEAFRERTLDFYITLCHRLMKQKARMAEEPDNLLKTCWALAEMLFSIRQSKKEGRTPDEELLGSAIQACWDLCDLFREGWSSIRPDSRQTPRPSQTTFTQAFQQARQAGMTVVDENGNLKLHPETPTTMIDESTNDSPCEAPVPNIVVLGLSTSQVHPHSALGSAPVAQSRGARQTAYRWPSSQAVPAGRHNASTSQPAPQSSSRTSAVETSKSTEEHSLVLLKSLFVRAALLVNRGYVPMNSHSNSSSNSHTYQENLSSLPLFVKSLPETAFGTHAWQMNLLDNYRRTVMNDSTFSSLGAATDTRLILPNATDPNTSAWLRKEVANAVRGMVAGTSGWSWLKDLFRFTFGVYIEEVLRDAKSGSISKSKQRPGKESSQRQGQPRAQSSSPDKKDIAPSKDDGEFEIVSSREGLSHKNSSEHHHQHKHQLDRADDATTKLARETGTSLSRSTSRHSRRGSNGSIASNSGEKRSSSAPISLSTTI